MKNLCKHFFRVVKSKHPASKSAKGIFLSLLLGSCLGLSSCSEEEIDSVERTKLELSFEIEGVKSRGRLTNNIPIGSKVGVKLDGGASTDYDIYKDLYYTCSGTEDNRTWTPSQDVGTSSNKATLYAYWPYTSGVNISAIPVDMTAADQIDWLYATPVEGICSNNAKIQATLNHALANISVSFDKGTYLGTGNITKIAVRGEGIASKGTFNAAQTTPDFTRYTDKGAAFERTVSTTPGGAAQEMMVIPTGVESPFTFTITLDGTEFTATTAPINLQKGYSYHYTLKLGSTSMEISTFKFTEWQTEIKESIQVDELDRFADWFSARYYVDEADIEANPEGVSINLFNSSKSSYVERMVVDGEEVTPSATYIFSTAGYHSVKFLLKLNSSYGVTIEDGMFSRCSNLTNVKFPKNLKIIWNSAFYLCTGLTGELVIPNSVTSIGQGAFQGCGITELYLHKSPGLSVDVFQSCSKLKKVTLEEGIKSIPQRTFDGCSSLTEINIPSSVTTIGLEAFDGCTGLTGELVIPNSVTSIADYAFQNCTGLTGELKLPESLTNIGNYVFRNCSGLTGELVIPNSVTKIGWGAFAKCTGFTSLKLSNTLETIYGYYSKGSSTTYNYDGAFDGCTGLTGELVIPNSVKTIGPNAFKGCTGLTGTLTIPNSVTTIGRASFEGCANLTDIVIGDGVEEVADRAFYGCTSVESLLVGAKVHTLGAQVFSYNPLQYIAVKEGNNMFDSRNNCNAIMNTNMDRLEKGSSHTTIPEDCVEIGNYAFENCKGLTSITIPNSVKTLGEYAFHNCAELTAVTIPNSVTSIGGYAFRNCTGLTSITIPNSVTSISNCVFYECTGLKEVDIKEGVQNIGQYTFYKCTGLTDLNIPNSVTKIDYNAFDGCTGLTNVTIGTGITTIGNYVFQNCTNLSQITLKATTPPTLSSYTFYNIKAKGLLILPESSEELYKSSSWISTSYYYLGYYNWLYILDNEPVNGVYYSADGKTALLADRNHTGNYSIKDGTEKIGNYAFQNCTGLTGELKLPESLTNIGNYAFDGCTSITALQLGGNLTSIGNYAFQNCKEIVGELVIPNSVTSIGTYAFAYNKKIISLNIGTGLSSIGSKAFMQCSNLEIIKSQRTTAPTISTDTFQDVKTGGTLTVPAGCKSAYSKWMQTSTSYYYLGRYSWTCKEAAAE